MLVLIRNRANEALSCDFVCLQLFRHQSPMWTLWYPVMQWGSLWGLFLSGSSNRCFFVFSLYLPIFLRFIGTQNLCELYSSANICVFSQ